MPINLSNYSNPQFSLRKSVFKLILIIFIVIVFSFTESGFLSIATLLLLAFYLLNKHIDKTLLIVNKLPIELKLLNLWFIFAFFTGFFISQDLNNFFDGIKKIFFYITIANFIAIILLYRLELANTIIFAIFLAGIINLAGVYLGFGAEHVERTGREVGFTSNPNSLGLRMVYASAALLFFLLSKKRKLIYVVISIALLIIFFHTLLLTGSRKALLAILLFILGSTLLYFTRNFNKIKIKNIIISIFTLIFLISILYYTIPIILEGTVVGQRIEMGNERGGIQGDIRYQMYVYGIELVAENPLFGVGMNNFRNYFWTSQYSHSDYIESLSSTGLLGFLIYQSAYFIVIGRGIILFLTTNNKTIRFYAGISVLFICMLKLIGTGTILFYSPGPLIILSLFSVITTKIKRNNFELLNRQ